ncbi:hypothetical protein HHX47_DHR10000227, partial [Lentinula edodes]
IVNFALSFIFASLALASPLTSSNPLGLGGQFDVFARNVAISSGCSTTGTASCHNTSAVSNTCCFEAPGGLILQTQ